LHKFSKVLALNTYKSQFLIKPYKADGNWLGIDEIPEGKLAGYILY